MGIGQELYASEVLLLILCTNPYMRRGNCLNVANANRYRSVMVRGCIFMFMAVCPSGLIIQAWSAVDESVQNYASIDVHECTSCAMCKFCVFALSMNTN